LYLVLFFFFLLSQPSFAVAPKLQLQVRIVLHLTGIYRCS
jgi:hypothetical protein